MVPNKRIEDIIRLAELYKRNIDSHYRFIFVGRTDGHSPLLCGTARARRAARDAAGALSVHRPGQRLGAGRVLSQRRASTCRSASTRASACQCSKRWRPGVPVFACDSTAPSARRSAAPASAGRPRIWSLRPSCSASWPSIRRMRAAGRRTTVPAPRGLQRGPLRPAPEGSIVERQQREPRELAFIVQRYGTEILGGSEYHCRLIAERLATEARRRGAHHVRPRLRDLEERISRRGRTACAASLSAASRSTETRDITSFNQFSDWIFNNPHTHEQEMEWLRRQGPWSPALIDYLKRHHQQYDALIFFTYLYAPTVLGHADRAGQEHPGADRARRARDSPGSYKEVFSLPAAIAYNTEVERRFLTTHFSHPRRSPRRLSGAASTCCRRARTLRATPTGPGPARRAGHCRRQRRRPAAAAAHRGPRRHVPPAPSPARAVRPVRRPHRSGQGLRGADRVLQQLRAGRRRRVARPHGREADAAARGALDPLCGPALGTRAAASARGGDHRRRAVAVREPVAAGARSVRRRHARARQRAQRGPGRPLRSQQRRPVLRRSRRVRRGAEPAARRRAAARRDGTQRQGIRPAELPLGRHHEQVRPAAGEGSGIDSKGGS